MIDCKRISLSKSAKFYNLLWPRLYTRLVGWLVSFTLALAKQKLDFKL